MAARRPFREMLMNAGFYGGLLLLTAITIIFSPPAYCWLRVKGLDSGRAVRRIVWLYGRGWLHLLSVFVPVRVRTGAREDYPVPCIVVANHQSFFDAFCMGSLPIYDLAFVVRAWPFRIPFYGPYMLLGEYLNSENLSAAEFLTLGKDRLNRGVSLIIFPEGTRSATGRLGRFYSGAFTLAVEAGVPIVPLCIHGTGRFLSRGRAWVRRAQISITTLPPLHPAAFAEHGPGAHLLLRRETKSALDSELRRLDGSANFHCP